MCFLETIPCKVSFLPNNYFIQEAIIMKYFSSKNPSVIYETLQQFITIERGHLNPIKQHSHLTFMKR